MGSPNAGREYPEQIGSEAAGRSVLEHLVREYRHGSESDWRQRLSAGELLLDGRAAGGTEVLIAGQRLVWHRPPWIEPEAPLSFGVLYEDEDLLAVDKPSGLPTLPNADFCEHTLLHLVRQRDPNAVPMHRLGRGTSGVVLFARTEFSRTALQAAWRRREVIKIYRALVMGHPREETFTVRTPIGLVPHSRVGEIHAASAQGRPSVSHVRVLARRPAESLVEVVIETGRPHQIRIHLAAAGHPLVGDPLYGPGGVPREDSVPSDLGYVLHASTLKFRHPREGRELEVCSDVPGLLR